MSHLAAYRMTIALGLGILAISLSIFVLAKRAQDNTHNAKRACAAALQVRDATLDVFIDARERTKSAPGRTAFEREQAAAFYRTSIRRLQRVHCKK